jgi:hypothetical protein
MDYKKVVSVDQRCRACIRLKTTAPLSQHKPRIPLASSSPVPLPLFLGIVWLSRRLKQTHQESDSIYTPKTCLKAYHIRLGSLPRLPRSSRPFVVVWLTSNRPLLLTNLLSRVYPKTRTESLLEESVCLSPTSCLAC